MANDSTYLLVDDVDLDLDQYDNVSKLPVLYSSFFLRLPIHLPLYISLKFDNMEWWEGTFDILDDGNDDDDDDDNDDCDNNANSVHRNRPRLESSIEKYIEDFDFDALNTNLDEEEMFSYPDQEVMPIEMYSYRKRVYALSIFMKSIFVNNLDDG